MANSKCKFRFKKDSFSDEEFEKALEDIKKNQLELEEAMNISPEIWKMQFNK